MKTEQNKTNQETKKHELLHVVITDANTGETLIDEKSTFVTGVGIKEGEGFSFVIGGGKLFEHFALIIRLRALADKLEKEARKSFIEKEEVIIDEVEEDE